MYSCRSQCETGTKGTGPWRRRSRSRRYGSRRSRRKTDAHGAFRERSAGYRNSCDCRRRYYRRTGYRRIASYGRIRSPDGYTFPPGRRMQSPPESEGCYHGSSGYGFCCYRIYHRRQCKRPQKPILRSLSESGVQRCFTR